MALKECKECGHEVSSAAKKCENCGAPTTAGAMQSCGCLLLFVGFALIAAAILIFSC